MTSTMDLADAYANQPLISTPKAKQARATLEQRIKELEQDAARYRWLRENDNLWGRIEMGHNGSYPERMDAAIDRAMSEVKA